MSKGERVGVFEVIQEIAKISNQTHASVRGTIDAYHKIILRELRQNKTVSFPEFASYTSNYRKSALINPLGVPIVGSNCAKIIPSHKMRKAINSTEPIDFDLGLFDSVQSKVIIALKKEVKRLRLSRWRAANRSNTLRDKYDGRVKEIRQDVKKLRLVHRYKKASALLVKRRATNLLNDKILRKRINSSYFLDAITAFPVLTEFYKKQSMTINEINMFIVVNHFEYFTVKDSALFGFKKSTALAILERLTEAGLIEKFTGKTNSYAVSLTGKRKFTNFSKEINKGVRALLTKYREKIKDEDDGLPVKFKD